MMNLSNIVRHLPSGTFDKSSIYKAATQENHQFKMSSIFWLIRNMIDEGLLVKVGRNKYCAVNTGTSRKPYSYPFSNELQNIITSLEVNYPLMDFQAWEAFQFNYFANHQIAHNIFFIEVENMLETSIYEFLRDSYNNQVLLKGKSSLSVVPFPMMHAAERIVSLRTSSYVISRPRYSISCLAIAR